MRVRSPIRVAVKRFGIDEAGLVAITRLHHIDVPTNVSPACPLC
jgi:hypothetical protein